MKTSTTLSGDYTSILRLSPTDTVQMWINPPMKIVPNKDCLIKAKVSSCLRESLINVLICVFKDLQEEPMRDRNRL